MNNFERSDVSNTKRFIIFAEKYFRKMRNNALSIANSILQMADREGRSIKPLALMKLVYIAYGYALAYLLRDVIDPRFDRVEAWKYGPVIPSVYHTFKHFQNSPITEKAVVIKEDGPLPEYVTPFVTDEKLLEAITKAWNDYKDFPDSKLVELCHLPDSPWAQVYKEGKNIEIPEDTTQRYYLFKLGMIKDDDVETYKDYMFDSIIGSWSDLPEDFAEQIIAARHCPVRTRPEIDIAIYE